MTDDATGESLDAEFGALVDEFADAGLPPWHSMSVDAARRVEDEVFSAGDGPEMRTVRDLEIDGPDGAVPMRAYRPPAETAPTDGAPGALVFAHGGVFVLGTLDSSDDICRELAARTGRVVLSVDYRLAPEHPFPAAVDDVYAAVEWAREHADAFGADTDTVGVAGSSAGGGIAAATALRAAGDDVDLDLQVLLYPMLSTESITVDDPGARRDSYREHDEAALLATADVAWGWNRYLRSPVDAHNPFAVPLRATDALLDEVADGLAPAVVATAGVDVLRDEAAAYADALVDAGVPVTHAHYPTLAHGFCSVTDDVALADEAFADVADAARDLVE
jgi:acetyl esterase